MEIHINQLFGKLTVIDQSFKKNKKIYYLCSCSCGNTTSVPAYRLNSGKTKSCGCLRKNIVGKSYKKRDKKSNYPWYIKEELQKGINPFFSLCTRVRGNAFKRKINFEITGKDVQNMYNEQQGRCYISNILLSFKRQTCYSMSIDRIDSSKGYTKDNCKLCCLSINYLKSDFLLEDVTNFLNDLSDNR